MRTELYRKDFLIDPLDLEMGCNTCNRIQNWDLPSSSSSGGTGTGTAEDSKSIYMLRYEDRRGREQDNKEENRQYEIDRRRQRTLRIMETILDVSQMRLLLPLLFISTFLSVTLFCQRIDGTNSHISYWNCAAPLLFFLVYFFLSVLLTKLLHSQHNSDRPNNSLSGLWINFESLPKSLIYNHQSQRLHGMPVLLMLTVLSALQLGENRGNIPQYTQYILIYPYIPLYTPIYPIYPIYPVILLVFVGLKLDLSPSGFCWGLVLLPLWGLFALYCLIPLRYLAYQHTSIYIAGCLLLWIPLFVFFVGLAIKLDHQHGLRLAYLLSPYFLIEGFILMSAVHLLCKSVISRRSAPEVRVEDQVVVFVVTVMSVMPFVLFQMLLCVRDDEMIRHKKVTVSATQTVVPLLIILGWSSVLSIYFSLFHTTAYQQTRQQLDEYSGINIVVNL